MQPAEVKQPSVIHCGPTTTVAQALRLIQASGVDCLVVVEGGRMVGVVTEHDLMHRARGAGLLPADSVELVLTRDAVYFCPERSP